jgi:GT2 family glycosyltransferase
MPKIYILLPVHNRKEVTARFIDCLTSQTYQDYQLILIDDGSTDGTEEMVEQVIQSLTIIKGTGQWWWAGSLQEGYKWFKTNQVNPKDIVLIINDDTEFEADFLEQALKILVNQPKTLLLAQCYSLQTNQLLDTGTYIDWTRLRFSPASNQQEINCLSTRGLFLRIEDFINIGGFYPHILPHYTSDYEFTVRAFRKGYNLISDPYLKIWVNELTTGYHQMKDNLWNVKQIFSIKSPENPIYFSLFIILACPLQWKILNICRIWFGFSRRFYCSLKNRI